ncbi:hypothetical protein [Alysiella crassa]|nr:hypothetical protein [Alysiella crassa]
MHIKTSFYVYLIERHGQRVAHPTLALISRAFWLSKFWSVVLTRA